MSKILFIGAGWEQDSLISQAKKDGHYVLGINPILDVDVKKKCDRYFICDASDITFHANIASTYNVDAVISDNCDYSLYAATLVSNKLNLNSVGLNQSLLAFNKHRQRTYCERDKSINQPNHFTFQTIEEYKVAAKKLSFPFIVKPNDSRGTLGITIVQDKTLEEEAFFHAILNSPSHQGIIEEFIDGTLFTVDGFCFADKHYSLSLASRKFTKGKRPVTKEIIYPPEAHPTLIKKIQETHEKVVACLGYIKGHTHGEYMVDQNENVFLVECTNRGGGVFTSSTIVPEVSGLNLNKIYINQMLGINTNGASSKNNPCILAFLDFENGNVIKSINSNEINALDYVLNFRSIYSPKDMVEPIDSCASRHMMVAIKGDRKNLEKLKSNLNITYY